MPSNEYWQFPAIDPVAFSIGPIDVHWYGISYLVAFAFAYFWGVRQTKTDENWSKEQFSDLLFWCFIGVFILVTLCRNEGGNGTFSYMYLEVQNGP